MVAVWSRQVGRTAARAALLAVFAAAAGLGFNHVRRVGIMLGPGAASAAGADTGEITVSETQDVPGAILFLDARARAAYAEGHIPGAISLPYEEFETAYGEVAEQLSPGIPLVAYCEGGECTMSHSLAKALRQGGYEDVRVLVGGYEAWLQAGLPVEHTW